MVEKTLKSMLIGILILIVLFGMTKIFAGQQILLSQQILVDNKYFSITEGAENKMKEIEGLIKNYHLKTGEQLFVKNMLFITAAEFALIKSINGQGILKLPAKICSSDVIVALLKYDTFEGGSCLTLQRVMGGKAEPSDLFLFTGDVDKIVSFTPSYKLMSFAQSVERFPQMANKYIDDRSKSPMSPVTKNLAENKFFNIENLLWFLKASFVNKKKPETIKQEAELMATKLKLK
jgi:hypothetical protein